LTGTSAEKHDSFLSPDGLGSAIAEFSGKTLIQGERETPELFVGQRNPGQPAGSMGRKTQGPPPVDNVFWLGNSVLVCCAYQSSTSTSTITISVEDE
jgi:hypothetical protein